MSGVLVLGPGARTPGLDAGVDTLAALAVRRLERDHVRVVALTPNPAAGAFTFASRSYAEPLDFRTARAVIERENLDGVVAAFGGIEGRGLAIIGDFGVPVLGLPRRRDVAGFAFPATMREPSRRVLVELLQDARGERVVVAAFDADPAGPLADVTLRTAPRDLGEGVASAIDEASARIRAAGAFGLFSLTIAAYGRVEAQLVEVVAGARFSTAVAAAATGYPIAETAAALLLGRDLERGAAAPRARQVTRTAVRVHERFPGATSETAGAVGQRVVVHDALDNHPNRDSLLVVGAGAFDLDRAGGRGAWAASAVLTAQHLGHHVTVVDDDPGSLAGALADCFWLADPREPAEYVGGAGDGALVAAAPDAEGAGRALTERGVRVLDVPPLVVERARGAAGALAARDLASRKVDVVVLCDGAQTAIAAAVEYVEPAAVNAADSTAFVPPQTLPENEVRALEDRSRTLVSAVGARGVATATWALSRRGPVLVELALGPSSIAPFVGRAHALDLPALATRLALGGTLRSLGVADVEARPFVAAREVALPRELLGRSTAALDGMRRSVGEAMGVGETLASAYRKALAGVGFSVDEPRAARAVLLAPAPDDCAEAVRAARKLHPLGFRLLALGPVTELLQASRLPFEPIDAAAGASRMDGGEVRLALVTGETAGLRNRALGAGVPCFTSTLLFAAACATLEEGIEDGVRPLP